MFNMPSESAKVHKMCVKGKAFIKSDQLWGGLGSKIGPCNRASTCAIFERQGRKISNLIEKQRATWLFSAPNFFIYNLAVQE